MCVFVCVCVCLCVCVAYKQEIVPTHVERKNTNTNTHTQTGKHAHTHTHKQEIVPTYGDNPIAIVSPDAGGVARAKMFMEAMTSMKVQNISLAITIKHRVKAGEIEGMNIVGEIRGKHCIIVDDMIDTAGTLCKSAESLKEMGALSVSACVTHPLFSGPALERIGNSVMAHVVVSDTIPIRHNYQPGSAAEKAVKEKIKIVSCARLLAQAQKF